MKQLMISTRGTYDLHNGKKIKNKKPFITPKKKYDKIAKSKEVVIFVHGMRNTTVGAKMGTNALRLRLRKLGYKGEIIGFSYDSNVRGAHLEKNYHKVLRTAKKIAERSGKDLADLINDIHKKNYSTKIRLVGHSLGCDVIKSAFDCLGFEYIESVHLFGSPVEIEYLAHVYNFMNAGKIINYYNPTDDVIREGVEKGDLERPSCLHRVERNNFPTMITSKRLYAKNHGFKAHMNALRSFP